MKKEHVTTGEAAKIIEKLTGYPMSVRQVQNEILQGNLDAIKWGSAYMVSVQALKKYKRRPRGGYRGKTCKKTKK